MLYFSVYLRLFLPSLHSLFLQIDHYLLRPNSANLLKKHLSTKLEIKSKQILSFSKKVGLIFDFKNWILVTFLSFFLHVF